MDKRLLLEEIGKFNLNLASEQMDLLEKFEKIMLEKNKVMNLTRITGERDLTIKHFADSLSLLSLNVFKEGQSLLDIGSGAGFPGIPLKIAMPGLKITLLDSLNKRVRFLNEVVEILSLEEIKAIHGRAEELGKTEVRESFDIVVSRAVARLNTLVEYSLPFVKVRGYFIAMKGDYKEELEEAKKAISLLGGEICETKEVPLADDISHSLIVIKKIKKTPDKYPRSGGQIKKSPIK
ncbi:MAG: 16S rRNA (guanine(527)-N(7))-methyltransferase RsmG [Tissierellia bacterium]|nr:16S rRNA (guanine(527)-N(7))-methyltransferase RsmG [Tissierellia bacterium]